MADQKYLAQAQAAFRTFCQTMDNLNWKYKKDDEKLSVESGAQGDDLPIKLTIDCDADRGLVFLISHLPFVIQEDKRLDVAIAVSAINNVLVDGCFDYDVTNGHMFFRMTSSFIDSTLGEELFAYMLFCSCQTIDKYNDRFLMISKGMMTIEQFLAALTK